MGQTQRRQRNIIKKHNLMPNYSIPELLLPSSSCKLMASLPEMPSILPEICNEF